MYVEKNELTKVSRKYGLTFLLTFLVGRFTFLVTFSCMHSFCLLPGAAAAAAAPAAAGFC